MQDKIQNTLFSPRIFRFITEQPHLGRYTYFTKLLLVSFLSGIILIGIMLQGVLLRQNLQRIDTLRQQRTKITQELTYWQNIARQYANYRDVYVRMATLYYQIGEKEQAEAVLKKALSLDPNFENAKIVEEKLRLQ